MQTEVKIKRIIKRIITLKLTEKEALYLKQLVQDPLFADENEEEYEIRQRFWNALPTLDDLRPIE